MNSEKNDLEAASLIQFSDSLAVLRGEARFAFHELRDPLKPDSLCSFDGQHLHVEVGHFYGTQSDAKHLLGRTGKSAPTPEEKVLSSLIPLDARLLLPLNRLLTDKSTKTYQTSRVWLLIRSTFPIWNLSDFEEHQARIFIPLEHPFEQIWLLCGPRASFGVLRLA